MTKDSKTNFDEELFKKRVRLADSDQGDGALAYTQATKQCRERTPPLLFYEAVVKYMSPPRPSMDEVEEENTRLEKENARLHADNVRMQQEITNLRANREKDEPVDEEHDFGRLVDGFYSSPEGRIITFFVLLAVRLGIYLKWEDIIHPGVYWTLNALFVLPMLMVAIDWISVQFCRRGLVVLLLRSGIIVGGLLIAYGFLFGLWPWENGDLFADVPSNLMRQPNGHLAFWRSQPFARAPKWLGASVKPSPISCCHSSQLEPLGGCFSHGKLIV